MDFQNIYKKLAKHKSSQTIYVSMSIIIKICYLGLWNELGDAVGPAGLHDGLGKCSVESELHWIVFEYIIQNAVK